MPLKIESIIGKHPVNKELKLCFLGCEDNPPYGPTDKTAKLFLNLIEQTCEGYKISSIKITIEVFRAKIKEYPEDFHEYDGVILPGSFSGAYEEDEWILELQKVVRSSLFGENIPTLGVCFGHQVFAHALEGGQAIENPHGSQAAVRIFDTTDAGKRYFGGKLQIPLLYTHGDRVERLPASAQSLGGYDQVPIEAAVYESDEGKPIAFTFQAHPEYASEGPEQMTLQLIMEKLVELEKLTEEQRAAELDNLHRNWDSVYKQSIEIMYIVGTRLGWFPLTQQT